MLICTGWDDGILGSPTNRGMSLGEKATLTISPYVATEKLSVPQHHDNSKLTRATVTMDMEHGKQWSHKHWKKYQTTESRPDPAYHHAPSSSQGAVLLQIMVQPEAKLLASHTRSVAGNSFWCRKADKDCAGRSGFPGHIPPNSSLVL